MVKNKSISNAKGFQTLNGAKKIMFTGGGSAGHVTLNLALIPYFLENGWKVGYIGSYNGIENDLLAKLPEVKYFAIATGKLRRYFSWQNFLDMVKIPVGILQALYIVAREKPDIIFSKGGFVSFPVVLAGKINGCPVVMHESDVTPGLANKMSLPFVSKFFTTFEDTIKYVKDKAKVEHVGPVMSGRLKNGHREQALVCCGFNLKKPIIMAIGGSLGAKSLNRAIRDNLPALLKKFQIIHICGKGQLEEGGNCVGYKQFEYVDSELKDFMQAAEIVISRAGSNSIFELLSLQKPMVLVPLPVGSSRGEQMLNARSFQSKGYCEIIADENLADGTNLLMILDKVYQNRNKYIENMQKSNLRVTDNTGLAQKIAGLAKGNKRKTNENTGRIKRRG